MKCAGSVATVVRGGGLEMRDAPWCRLWLVSGRRANWDFWHCFSVFSVIAGRRVTVPGESSEIIRRNIIEVLFCWWPPHPRRSLRSWYAKRVSDFEDLPFIGEESDDAHGPLAAGTPVSALAEPRSSIRPSDELARDGRKRVNFKEAFYACSPAQGRFCSLLLRS